MFKYIFLGFLVFSSVSRAESSWQWSFEFLAAGQFQEDANSSLNRSNRVFELPQWGMLTDSRAQLIYKNESWRMVLRPRYQINYKSIRYELPTEDKNGAYGKADLSDFFVENGLSDSFSFSLGLQNYQWGPAETISPSNPFFHFEAGAKSFLYKQKGLFLAKLNGSLTQNTSLTLLSEISSNNESPWIAERSFEPKFLFRLEQKFSNSFNYAGVTLGNIENNRFFFGEYANGVLTEGLSIYADARHVKGSYDYRPQQNIAFLYDMTLSEEAQEWNHLAVAGVRWESTVDLRLEYIYNTRGFGEDTLNKAIQSGSTLSLNLPQNLTRLAHSGLEFLGIHYAYFSMRWSDLGVKKDINLYLRYLHSLQDQSGSLLCNLEKPLNDSMTGFFESSFTVGSKDKEFTLADRNQWLWGFRWTL